MTIIAMLYARSRRCAENIVCDSNHQPVNIRHNLTTGYAEGAMYSVAHTIKGGNC